MKYFIDAIRMVFISVECFFVLLICLLYTYCPNLFSILGDSIASNAEVTKWLPVIPLGLSVYCFGNLIWKMITPLSGSNKKLYDWPDFWRLKMRCYFSLILSAVCAAIACGLWIFAKAITHNFIGVLFTLSMGLSLINAGCMAFASFALRMILEKEDETSS